MGNTVDTTIRQLEELLGQLYVPPNSVDMLTREDINTRYRLTGLRGPAMSAIAQSRRIIRATGNYDDMGLFEFHIGLVYLDHDQYQIAAQHFVDARRLWSFANRTAAICLTHFAQGCSLQHAKDNENAMIACGRGVRCLNRFTRHGVRTDQITFVERLRINLEAERELLRKQLRTEDDENGPAPTSPPPGTTSTERLPTPVSGHAMHNVTQVWYRILRNRTLDGDNIREIAYILIRPGEAWQNGSRHFHTFIIFEAHGVSLELEPLGVSHIGKRIVQDVPRATGDFSRDPGVTWLSESEETALEKVLQNHMDAQVIGYWFDAALSDPGTMD